MTLGVHDLLQRPESALRGHKGALPLWHLVWRAFLSALFDSFSEVVLD
jgi:hypothetical protein